MPRQGVEVGGRLYFVADDGVHGRELWRSDRTADGTALVDDIRGGAGDSDPGSLVGMDGDLYFAATDRAHGRQLWRSDGTRAGTVLVKAIGAGGYGTGGTGNADGMVLVGERLFFVADDGIHGSEVWTSDGTTAGTVMVKDVGRNDAYPGPTGLEAVGDTVFFTEDDGVHGQELWQTDGTRAGTTLVKDLSPGSASTDFSYSAGTSDSLLFFADAGHGRELWVSDGTADGTHVVEDVAPATAYDGGAEMVAVGQQVFFVADDGTHGRELWTSDGTETGTVLVKDISSDDEGGYYGNHGPEGLSAANGLLYFSADDDVHGREPWRSDGTEDGTVLVDDVNPGEAGSGPADFTAVGGSVYFASGIRLFATDGTSAGTRRVADVQDAGSKYTGPTGLAAVGERLFLAADDGVHGMEPWLSDGTATGTAMVADVNTERNFVVIVRDARTRNGKLEPMVYPNVPGRLQVRPVGGSELRPWSGCVDGGRQRLVLSPTRAGERKLHRTGSLRVRARFVFGEPGTTIKRVVKSFTLRVR
ncbi:ELWxxDGT repeat protein [Nocardioides mangrovi]|uniref:Hyalin n=1 Tax=Nocardioides mangrovi TaxID=2874580 RepID=A0ABS7UHE5_9ACTN|nr:ELWxxDGT repeat protein [Nocardioides mangrovi]MBZ5740207.1 hypothetical protein [Nocardioides mangrovi]